MSEGSGQQRYCGNCGTEVRPGMAFCVSCGAPVTPVAGGPGPSSTGSDSPGRLGSFLGDLRSSLRQSREGLGGTFSGLGTDGIRGLPRRAVGWFRDLSGVPKLVLVGLVVLVLLVLLSPVVALVAALLVGVSIIALMIRVAQKRSVKNWGMVAVGSVVLVFTFGFMSNALYGIGFMGSSSSGSGESSGTPGGSDRSGGIPDNGSPDSQPSSTAAFNYKVFSTNVSDSSYSVAPTAGYDVLTLVVETDAHSQEDLGEVARTVFNDYSDPQYDVIELLIVGPGEQSPMMRDPEVIATAPMTQYGASLTGIALGDYHLEFDTAGRKA